MSRIHVWVGGGREVTVRTRYRSGKSAGPDRSCVAQIRNASLAGFFVGGSLSFGSCARNAPRPSAQPNPKEPEPLSKAPRCLEICHRSK
jgi:hypothetical protein